MYNSRGGAERENFKILSSWLHHSVHAKFHLNVAPAILSPAFFVYAFFLKKKKIQNANLFILFKFIIAAHQGAIKHFLHLPVFMARI